MSWRGQVKTSPEALWAGNALRFATQREAEAHIIDLACRWTSVVETRTVETEDPVNSRWNFDIGAIEEVKRGPS